MTDVKKFVELYKSFGVTLKPWEDDIDGNQHIELNDIESGKMVPIHCYSDIMFDKAGKFISQSFWD